MTIEVRTDHPIAVTSLDHLQPWGTMRDNSRNHAFNELLYGLFPAKELRIMDLGCSGGGFVKDCIDDGHIAIGLEGSDYSFKQQRAEWTTIPENLFLCDITKAFQVLINNQWVKFDVITAWEVMEHIAKPDLPMLCNNINKHLADNGLVFMSVSPRKEKYHQTVESREWWSQLFASYGLLHCKKTCDHFNRQWIRGGGRRDKSYNFVLKRQT